MLIDEDSTSQVLTGEMRLRCLGLKRSKCSKKTFVLPFGRWQIDGTQNHLFVKNLENGATKKLQGKHFQITGQFSLVGKTLKKLDILFIEKKTHWVVSLPIDQYLYGVMTSEVPVSWPMQALQAQAIASRTYFLFKKRERAKEHFDVRSDIMDQVFKLDGLKHKNIIEAVNQTHGMILVTKDKGKVFPAYFHSDCGGKTSSENKVWRKPSSMNQAVRDPYCQSATKNNWSHAIDKEKLLALLHSVFYLPRGVQLKSILPRLQEQSRAHIVDFLFSNNILKRISATHLRPLLGFGKLRTTPFEVSQTWNEVIFRGRGFGHGVGMCQWGAQRWARKGKSFRSILKHYYPQAELKQLDARSLQAQMVF